MLKLSKETLAELTPDQMSAVVGAQVLTGLTIAIHYPGDSCWAASCITN